MKHKTSSNSHHVTNVHTGYSLQKGVPVTIIRCSCGWSYTSVSEQLCRARFEIHYRKPPAPADKASRLTQESARTINWD